MAHIATPDPRRGQGRSAQRRSQAFRWRRDPARLPHDVDGMGEGRAAVRKGLLVPRATSAVRKQRNVRARLARGADSHPPF